MVWWWVWASGFGRSRVLLPLLALIVLPACDREPPRRPPPVPVRVARVAQRDVPIKLLAIGTMEANRTVDVKAQVGGVLREVAFREGDKVRRGQLLFRIDPQPSRVALAQARARLRGDLARLKNAERELARARSLVPDVVSRADFEKVQADHDAAAAAVETDRAAIASARLSLGYATIRAPISGKAGGLLVNEGNLVKENAETPLVVIREISPIKVAFSVPEQSLDEVRRRLRGGELELTVRPRGEREAAAQPGQLSFVDNAINRTTGTVLLKGLLENREESLWPGEFVDVSLRLGERQRAMVVPSEAVQSGQQGQFVYRVKQDQTVEVRRVTTGGQAGDGAVIVERGVAPGDVVVTDGQIRLRPGVRVQRQAEPRVRPVSGRTEPRRRSGRERAGRSRKDETAECGAFAEANPGGR